jgi:hypothetical protein
VEFAALLKSLQDDLRPIGALELILVEQIANCCWRLRSAIRCEKGEIRRGCIPQFAGTVIKDVLESYGETENSEFTAIRTHLSLPNGSVMDKILRYETSVHRQFNQALATLERLQRARMGDSAPPPLSIQFAE